MTVVAEESDFFPVPKNRRSSLKTGLEGCERKRDTFIFAPENATKDIIQLGDEPLSMETYFFFKAATRME